jgi:D-3-phosphoglycerate dehydrogenase / 2-oxoglutarate reductase
MYTILVSAPYILPILDRFRSELERHDLKIITPTGLQERLEEAEILSFAGQFDGTICGDDQYSAAALRACAPRLKVISKWGTGIDSIDVQVAASLGIRVCRTPNAFTLPVADTVMAYMLAFVRRQPWMDRAMRQGQWQKIPGRSLSECTLGVVGVGNCGKAVLRRARAFGMKLLGNDIIEIEPDFVRENRVEMVSLPDLLQRADFVSLNPELNPTSYHLINAHTLSLMRPEAVLINASRGHVIDEPALITALQQGIIGGAALDVYEVEPLPLDSPLLQMENVMLAPHNANSSPAAWERVHRNTINNLLIGLDIQP